MCQHHPRARCLIVTHGVGTGMTFRCLGVNKMLGPRCERNLNPYQPPPGFPEPFPNKQSKTKKQMKKDLQPV